MATLNNNAVAAVLNEAIAESTGAEAVSTLDLEGIIDAGNSSDIIGSVEQFTKSLVNVLVKNWYTDTSYRSQYKDLFFQDSATYGAITQMISAEAPEVEESSAWKDFGSGIGQTSTVGTYTVHVPVVSTQYYGKSVSWQLPITITDEQWETAFQSASELSSFVNYILLVVDNALICHMENMDAMNRNNFMAEKIAYAASNGATGIHVINLVQLYQESLAIQSNMSVEAYMNSADGLRHGASTINLFKGYFSKMNTQFNTAGKKRFTPDDRLVIQIVDAFWNAYNRVAQADTFHNDLTALPNFQSVPFWQGSNTYAFDEVTKIDVETSSDGTAVEQSGIVAFMCDKWAIIHTIISKKVKAKVFEPENLTNYYYQFNDRYMNNLTLNALVFTLEDYTAPENP